MLAFQYGYYAMHGHGIEAAYYHSCRMQCGQLVCLNVGHMDALWKKWLNRSKCHLGMWAQGTLY